MAQSSMQDEKDSYRHKPKSAKDDHCRDDPAPSPTPPPDPVGLVSPPPKDPPGED
jgi:hypothetical protein